MTPAVKPASLALRLVGAAFQRPASGIVLFGVFVGVDLPELERIRDRSFLSDRACRKEFIHCLGELRQVAHLMYRRTQRRIAEHITVTCAPLPARLGIEPDDLLGATLDLLEQVKPGIPPIITPITQEDNSRAAVHRIQKVLAKVGQTMPKIGGIHAGRDAAQNVRDRLVGTILHEFIAHLI